MNRKPRILLIPNVAWWIVGEMGKQIIARFGDRYDFYFVPEGLFERRPDLLDSFVPAVDAIHCLNESSIDLFRDRAPASLPPIITWIHHVTTWSPQHQLAMERSAAITVCTQGWKEDIARRTSAQIPVSVVPHGVDSSAFQRRVDARAKYGISSDRFVVGFVGSKGSDTDRGRKGTDIFMEVVLEAARQLPTLHVLMGGPGWDTELAELRSLGVSASATGYIKKAELPDLYSALDAYLLTSRVEGGPCTVFEAMACQTPVVATRVGAVPDLIVDAVNGYSAEVDDVHALCEAILVLGRCPELRERVAERARESVKQRPWSLALTPLGAVYEEVLKGSRGGRAAQEGPSWMRHPEKILRTSSTADALGNVLVRLRKGAVSPAKAVRLLADMLDHPSIPDLVRGLAMLRGYTYRPKGWLPVHAGGSRGAAGRRPVKAREGEGTT